MGERLYRAWVKRNGHGWELAGERLTESAAFAALCAFVVRHKVSGLCVVVRGDHRPEEAAGWRLCVAGQVRGKRAADQEGKRAAGRVLRRSGAKVLS
jgi:hypothetical protein